MAEVRFDVIRSDDPEDLCRWQLQVVIDGVDITGRGCGMDPDDLLPRGLEAGVEPRRVVLVRCGCSVVGCGSASAAILREGEHVRWTDWQSDLGGPVLEDLRFDAAMYDREVRRADEDRGWEPPARRIARQARSYLTGEVVAALAAHGLRDPRVVGTDRGTIEVWFGVGEWERGHWQVWVDVTGAEPTEIVEQLVVVPPSEWQRVKWLPNDEFAMASPPPMASPSWTKAAFG